MDAGNEDWRQQGKVLSSPHHHNLALKSVKVKSPSNEVVYSNLGNCNIFNVSFFLILYSRKLSTMILNCGAIEMPIILQEARLGLTHKKPKCRAIGHSLWTPTLVEMWPNTAQIMETKISKPWVTSWCSERKTDIVAWEYLRNIGVLLKDWKTAVEWKTKVIKNGVGNSCALKNTYRFSIWWTVHVYYSWGAICKKIIYNKFVTFFAYSEIIKTTSKNCL